MRIHVVVVQCSLFCYSNGVAMSLLSLWVMFYKWVVGAWETKRGIAVVKFVSRVEFWSLVWADLTLEYVPLQFSNEICGHCYCSLSNHATLFWGGLWDTRKRIPVDSHCPCSFVARPGVVFIVDAHGWEENCYYVASPHEHIFIQISIFNDNYEYFVLIFMVCCVWMMKCWREICVLHMSSLYKSWCGMKILQLVVPFTVVYKLNERAILYGLNER